MEGGRRARGVSDRDKKEGAGRGAFRYTSITSLY
jgi:hypothetical protein